jgi:cephalosporin hydroxylase
VLADRAFQALADVRRRLPKGVQPRLDRLKETFEERVLRPAALRTAIRRTGNFSKVEWLGRPVWQNVTDAWLLQETIVELGVDLVIECGTNRGGSAFYMATIFDALAGDGHVVTIDVERMVSFEHPRITFLTGSSTSDEILDHVRAIAGERIPKTVLVLLDSDHSAPHVLEEMKRYAGFVTPGSYLFVQDGCIDELPSVLHGQPGPLVAIREFVKSDDRFVVDRERSERYLISHSPSGWLKRLR